MRTKILSIAALAALVLAGIVSISPSAKIVADEAGRTIDILGLTKSAQHLPVQEYPAH